MAKDLEQLNNILFDQLETLAKLDVKSEDFEKEKDRATIVCETADRIIKNSELGLRNQVWQATRKFKLLANSNTHLLGSATNRGNNKYGDEY